MNEPELITSRFCAHLLAALSYSNRYFYLANFSLQISDTWIGREIATFFRTLAARVESGLDARVILATPPSHARLTARNTLSARFITGLGIPLRYYSGPAVLHAKFIVADDLHVIVGSHNLNHNSLHRNIEVSLRVECTSTAWKLRTHFLALWERSKEPTYK